LIFSDFVNPEIASLYFLSVRKFFAASKHSSDSISKASDMPLGGFYALLRLT